MFQTSFDRNAPPRRRDGGRPLRAALRQECPDLPAAAGPATQHYTTANRSCGHERRHAKRRRSTVGALVRSAIGFDQKRGDQVEGVNLRFADVPNFTVPEPRGFLGMLQFTKDDVIHRIEQLIMVVLGIVSRISVSGVLMGNYDATERLLQQYLPSDRVGGIMEEIRGPAGRNMWEKLFSLFDRY